MTCAIPSSPVPLKSRIKPTSPGDTKSNPIVVEKMAQVHGAFRSAFNWDLGSYLQDIMHMGKQQENTQHQRIPDINSHTVMEWLKQHDTQHYDDVMEWREEYRDMQCRKARSYASEFACTILRRAEKEERDYGKLSNSGDAHYQARRYADGEKAALAFKRVLDEASKGSIEDMLITLKKCVSTGLPPSSEVIHTEVYQKESSWQTVQGNHDRRHQEWVQEAPAQLAGACSNEHQQEILALCHSAAEEALRNGFACIRVSRVLNKQTSGPD